MLSDGDREWLEAKFNRVHERMDAIESRAKDRDSDIHKLELDLTQLKAAGCPSVLAHEEKHHNPVKTWGIVASLVGVATGIMEICRQVWKGWGKP